MEQAALPVWLSELFYSLANSEMHTRLVYGGICLAVLLTGAALFYIELRPLFLSEKRFLISRDDFGKVEIAQSCLGKLANYEASKFGEVSNSASEILDKKGLIFIKSNITVKPDTKLAELAAKLQNNVKNQVEKNLGLTVSSMVVTASFDQKFSSTGRSLK